MINETLEVKEYLNGENINKDCLYRICYLLSKYCKENGIVDKLDIREFIFDWANLQKINISISLNNCITNAVNDKKRLTNNNFIYISETDIEEIKKRFDTKNSRLLSLSLLCYAKQFADSNNEFEISLASLSNWTGIIRQHISSRYIPELIDFRYISKVRSGSVKSFTWDSSAKSKMNKYKILVPIENSGSNILCDNNIKELYLKIFK